MPWPLRGNVGGFFEREKAEYSQELGSANVNIQSDVSKILLQVLS